MLEKLYQPRGSPANVAVFMSRTGTNAVRLIEAEQRLSRNGGSPFRISLIVTDNRGKSNNAWNIAREFKLEEPLHVDFKEFALAHQNPNRILDRRPYYDRILGHLRFSEQKIDLIAFAGFELIITYPFLQVFKDRMLNVHPADLTIRNAAGKPVYTGNAAVLAAILDGQTEIRASTHIVTEKVDEGPVLMVSDPVKVVLPAGLDSAALKRPEHRTVAKAIAECHQDELKEVGDWRIYPLTLELMARGLFERDDQTGVMHLVSMPIPNGFRINHAEPSTVGAALLRC